MPHGAPSHQNAPSFRTTAHRRPIKRRNSSARPSSTETSSTSGTQGTHTNKESARIKASPHRAEDDAPDSPPPLETLVYERLREYAQSLQGHFPEDMYRLIMPQLERPLIKVALELAGGEKKRAASMLGIHRNTLRARMRELGLEDAQPPSAPRRPPQ